MMNQAYRRAKLTWPGFGLCLVVALAASFVAAQYDAPAVLFALLMGMSLSFLRRDEVVLTGVDFSSKTLLRIAVVLMGFRVSFSELLSFGLGTLWMVLVLIGATLLSGVALAKLFNHGRSTGLLTGGAVAICGASAALAISAILPRSKANERATLVTILGVTTLSTVAMVFYPPFFAQLGFSQNEAGVLVGASIHDVAQVAGAGYSISPEAGDAAIIVKLIRVSMLPIVLVLIATMISTSNGLRGTLLPPWFVVGFFATAAINSFDLVPTAAADILVTVSSFSLVVAIAGLGLKTSLDETFGGGRVLFGLVLAETLVLLCLAVALKATAF